MAPRHIMVERDRIPLGIESHDPLDDPSALGTYILALGVLLFPRGLVQLVRDIHGACSKNGDDLRDPHGAYGFS
mgnify:FL=1